MTVGSLSDGFGRAPSEANPAEADAQVARPATPESLPQRWSPGSLVI